MTFQIKAGRYPTDDFTLQETVLALQDGAPELLDTLNELAASINDDPDFVTTMLSANSTLQSSIDAVQADVDANEATALSDRNTLQSLLQSAIDAVQADVNQNEADADTAIALVSTNLGTNYTTSASFESAMITRELNTHGSLFTETLTIG